ncbi:MAG: 2-amino-4-hydroxy-6-hydroxymethyldihydropteridine diphosphokinase [Aquabacterium sp.]|nr:2-amino-4-hydroxy-6-hydroxymethyldihydropteridine diphosphokinase [Aquabacterium sp.]
MSAVPRQRAFIGLGGNLGDVQVRLRAAVAGLRSLPGTQVEAVSSLYRTLPVESSGPDYLNAVAVLQSCLGPRELLRALHALEHTHDRERPYQNAPRTLDLDLLDYGGHRCHGPFLTLPHPRMMKRAFVLEPLVEVLARLPAPTALKLPDAATRQTLAHQQGIAWLASPAWADLRDGSGDHPRPDRSV